jgi:2,5-diketo-D-gluconate reductase A
LHLTGSQPHLTSNFPEEIEEISMTVSVKAIPLNDGTTIPQLGLGVFQMSEEEAEAAVVSAHDAGYRLVDSAAGYENEGAVGRAIARFDRNDFYVTTKLKNTDHGYDQALSAFDESMTKLGIDTLDLYLIHWPSPAQDKYVDTWRALIRLRDEGKVTSIGVSNFEPHHLRRLIEETGVVPAINQIELHPFLQQKANRAFHSELGIATQAWSPLGSGKGGLLEHRTLAGIARDHDATPAQFVLAWHLAIGNVVIPKTVTPARLVENMAAAQLRLSSSELGVIASMDDGTRFGPHPDEFS